MTRLPTAMSASRTHVRRRRLAIAVGLAALGAAVVWCLVVASALVGFGFAVTAAVAWCVWLERQPVEPVGAAHAPDQGAPASPNCERRVLVAISPVVSRQVKVEREAGSVGSLSARATVGCRIAIITIGAMAAVGCDVNSALERLSQARHLSAELLVQFTQAADAANKAVMADTDEASVAFSREAEQAKQSVQTNIDELQPILHGLNYSEETRLLQEFVSRFAEYRELDRRILDLAVENTNLKAQRLSFGAGQEAADSFRDAVEALAPLDAAKDTWRVKALAATAVATVRELQVLQAPHIAEADDTVMTRMEKRMATSEAAARSALQALAPLVHSGSRPQLATATAALDRFMEVNAQIAALSRRNTNVRSLALSLNQKGKVTGACEDSLRALRDALAKRGFTGTR